MAAFMDILECLHSTRVHEILNAEQRLEILQQLWKEEVQLQHSGGERPKSLAETLRENQRLRRKIQLFMEFLQGQTGEHTDILSPGLRETAITSGMPSGLTAPLFTQTSRAQNRSFVSLPQTNDTTPYQVPVGQILPVIGDTYAVGNGLGVNDGLNSSLSQDNALFEALQLLQNTTGAHGLAFLESTDGGQEVPQL